MLAAHHPADQVEDQRNGARGPSPSNGRPASRLPRNPDRRRGPPILLQFCRSLNDMNDRYRRIFLAAHAFDRDVAAEHKGDLDATLARPRRQAKANALSSRTSSAPGATSLASMRP